MKDQFWDLRKNALSIVHRKWLKGEIVTLWYVVGAANGIVQLWDTRKLTQPASNLKPQGKQTPAPDDKVGLPYRSGYRTKMIGIWSPF